MHGTTDAVLYTSNMPDTITPTVADKSEGVFNAVLMPAERYPVSPTSAHLITTGHWRICRENEIFD